MKKFKATFDRYNPQLGVYETERIFSATNKTEAKKQAKGYEKCIYGSMTLKKIEEITTTDTLKGECKNA